MLFLSFQRHTHDSGTQNIKVNKKTVATSAHRRADARRTWARRRTKRARRREEGLKRGRPDNEAEETGQVRVNLHESLDQQGSQANERARPPVLKAVSLESIANSSPECMPRIMVQGVVVGKRVIQLGDGEDVQGDHAPQGSQELIHVGGPAAQAR